MSKSVLIVDDDQRVRKILRAKLEPFCGCMEAVNGKEAISKMLVYTPDLIVLDVMIPEIDGITVLKRMRAGMIKKLTTIPVIILTGSSDKSIVQKALNLGINGYVLKPFNINEIYGKIVSILNNPM